MSDRPLKILQVCSARDIGGGEKHFADLANTLAKRGDHVFAAVGLDSPLIKDLESLSPDNIFQVRMRNSFDLLAAGRLAALVRKHGIDIIHAHVARDYPLAAVASALSGHTPFMLTRHVLFWLSSVHRLMLRRASRIIAVSSAVEASLKKQDIFEPERIVMIHNGIDLEHFSVAASERHAPGIFRVGMIGHISSIKGHEDFVRAAAIVIDARDDVEFIMIGEDKSRHRRNRVELERLISDMQVGHRVRLAGWTDDVVSALSSFDVFISPSRSEPFGLVILEAMAAGVPVIATASEGAVEIITDGVDGVLATIGAPEMLATAILRLLDQPELRQKLVFHAKKTVEAFSIDGMVDSVGSLYREVVSERAEN
jgi:glycosyltransferase involved in cell wall biosynthesis